MHADIVEAAVAHARVERPCLIRTFVPILSRTDRLHTQEMNCLRRWRERRRSERFRVRGGTRTRAHAHTRTHIPQPMAPTSAPNANN